jgi:hypothetical protein
MALMCRQDPLLLGFLDDKLSSTDPDPNPFPDPERKPGILPDIRGNVEDEASLRVFVERPIAFFRHGPTDYANERRTTFTTERANGNLHPPPKSYPVGVCGVRVALFVTGLVFLIVGLALAGSGGLPRTRFVAVPEAIQVSQSTQWQVEWRTFTPEGLWGTIVGNDEFPSTFNFDWGTGDLFAAYSDWIGFSATAVVKAPRSGPVTFTIGSDDGSQLFVDGQEKISLWSDHFYTTRSAIVHLTEGEHSVRLSFYERTGLARVSFSAPGDVLSWEDTQYGVGLRQVNSVDTTLQGAGAFVAVAGIFLAAIGAASRTRRPAREP